MARVAGVDIPREKRVEISLTYIYGIGPTTSKRILQIAGISPDVRVKDLNDAQVGKLRDVIAKNMAGQTEGDLRRQIALNIKRLVEIGSYRGQRHRKGLPAHGQRTRTNARTRRGVRKTVGGRKKDDKETAKT